MNDLKNTKLKFDIQDQLETNEAKLAISLLKLFEEKGEGNVVRKDIFDTANKVLEEVKL